MTINAKNLDSLKEVVMGFNPEEAKSIRDMEALMDRPSLSVDLAFIHTNLEFLPGSITQLEEAGLPLTHALDINEEAQRQLEALTGH